MIVHDELGVGKGADQLAPPGCNLQQPHADSG